MLLATSNSKQQAQLQCREKQLGGVLHWPYSPEEQQMHVAKFVKRFSERGEVHALRVKR